MTIWVDADSCPRRIREIVVRAARRTRSRATFVANRKMPEINGRGIRMQVVEDADAAILEQVAAEDLAITRDIPLAEALVERGVLVLNDRGTVYTTENIGERRSWRDFMAGLRERGTFVPEQDRFGNSDVQAFAAAFDAALARKLRERRDEQ
ncbi:MAG: DUF188 domain-containing protein [Spirochaetia bacterium]